jgi:protein-tyrosine phosphatase
LKANQIKTVITAAAGLDHLQIPGSVTHIVYPLQDVKTENIKSYFDECFVTIDRSKGYYNVELNEGGVLVHCAAGVSRVHTVLYSRQHWSLLIL